VMRHLNSFVISRVCFSQKPVLAVKVASVNSILLKQNQGYHQYVPEIKIANRKLKLPVLKFFSFDKNISALIIKSIRTEYLDP